MSSLKQAEHDLYVPASEDATIQEVLEDAVMLAAELKSEVAISYNGRIVRVRADSDLELMARDYERCRRGIVSEVGPYPEPMTQEQLDLELVGHPAFGIRNIGVEVFKISVPDKETLYRYAYTAAESDYLKSIMEPAIIWAHLIERKMAEGKELADVAQECLESPVVRKLKTFTGADVTFAVGILTVIWEYGQQLESWHIANMHRMFENL